MQHQANQEFDGSPAGRARAARHGGARIFQLVLNLSHSDASRKGFWGSNTVIAESTDHAWYLDSIEREGWTLISSDFVFRPTRHVTQSVKSLGRTKEGTAIEGDTIAIYMFRVVQ